jgi:Family of unknown function (DUF6624)
MLAPAAGGNQAKHAARIDAATELHEQAITLLRGQRRRAGDVPRQLDTRRRCIDVLATRSARTGRPVGQLGTGYAERRVYVYDILSGFHRILQIVLCLATPVLAASCDAPTGRNSRPAADTTVTHPALRDKLLRMGLLDQTVRVGFTAVSALDTGFVRTSMGIDSMLTQELRTIVDSAGWPTRSMVGSQAADAAFLILQHSPSDAFQRAALPLLQKAAVSGQAETGSVALLTDRILTHDGKAQLYGTQFRIVDGELLPYPIENLDMLDQRRDAAGLMPMIEYVKLLQETYEGPVRWPPDSTR